ncbi:MAG TPA: AraC family transcriptional regulator [Candidatus Eisenbergiella merdavium]|uniref:AraC family transcriptional regulator n=1 Tax=Candidatus Eisenbergiella merdavium TaxID=2838551 RepID=A0A9D2NBS6_9FIRM|nr:AraC family transcriptional regulator [Candidatus Eisenbergiella merdavium]
MSVSHFQHLYSRFFGISFQNDLIRMRIDHAQTLLTTTFLSTEQIAEACGYSNSTHFFRQFKKITGVSPAKYRKGSC